MVSERLRAVMIEAAGAGELDGADVRRGAAAHPACGDRIELSVRCRDGVVAELRWLADGCPGALAVAALAARVLPGTEVAAAAARLHQALAEHGGLAAHERHAEGLLLRAFAAATASGPG